MRNKDERILNKIAQSQRVFIFDPCFGGLTGHWENYCKRLYNELLNRQCEVIVYGQENYEKNIVGSLNFIPLFTTSPFLPAQNMQELLQIANLFIEDFNKIDIEKFQDGDIFIFHSIYPNYFKAIISWTNELINHKQILSLFTFQFPPSDTKEYVGILKNSYYKLRRLLMGERLSARKLQWCDNNQVRLYQKAIPDLRKLVKRTHLLLASTDVLSKNYTLMLGLKVHCLPMPGLSIYEAATVKSDQSTDNHEVPSQVIKVGYFGHSCVDKGSALLEQIINRTLEKHENVEFHIHVNPNDDVEKYFKKIALISSSRIYLYHGHINEAELMKLINKVNIVILPYSSKKYATCSSAVFMEAITFAKVVVIPSDTWMDMISLQYDIEAYRFNNFSVNSICKALDFAIDNYCPNSLRMEKASKLFSEENNIKVYLDEIFKNIDDFRAIKD